MDALPMTKSAKAKLSTNEIVMFSSAIAQAASKVRETRQAITDHYDLGPRGSWILDLIHAGFDSPSALAGPMNIGRSLVTAELKRLMEADLLEQSLCFEDRRRLKLTLTILGDRTRRQVIEDMSIFLHERLGEYSREELLFCGGLLQAFAGTDTQWCQTKQGIPTREIHAKMVSKEHT